MDLSYYIHREQQERAFATQAASDAARSAHLEMADRYRAVIDAHEKLEAAQVHVVPTAQASA